MTAGALDRTVLISRDFIPRGKADLAVVNALRNTNVAIVADAANLASVAGQACLSTLAMLVLQLGCGLRLVLPEVELRGHQPPLRGDELRVAILELASNLIPGGHAEVALETAPGDAVFVLGDTPWAGRAALGWRIHGTRWSGSMSPVRTNATAWHGDCPIGALAAAAMAAAEPFKMAMRMLLGGSAKDYEELSAVNCSTVTLGPEALDPSGLDIGQIACVSGGAIVQAFAHAIFRVPHVNGDLHVIEPERLDLTNLNRYALALLSQLGLLKVDVISAAAPSGIRVRSTVARLDEGSASALLQSADAVVVGTDNIRSRWIAQATHPMWLGVGATSKFFAVCSEHGPGLACARCMHPVDDNVEATIPTISFVSYWGGLMLAARLLRHAAGMACDGNDQALTMATLRVDGRHAQWRHAVVRDRSCDFGCWRAA